MSRIEKIRKICAGKKVLDLGVCGGGGSMVNDQYWLHGHVREVAERSVGVDINSEKLSRLPDDWELVEEDVEKLDLGENFDVVIAGELIEHLENPGLFLNTCKRHLKEDGKLVLSTPNLHCARLFLGSLFWPARSSEYHVMGFTKNLLAQLLERKGFEVENIELIRREKIPTLRGKILTFLCPKSLQNTIFCVARCPDGIG